MALSVGLLASPSAADDPPADAAQPAEESVSDSSPIDKVEKVVVTATRREVTLQKVPVAVTALGSKALAAASVENIDDLPALVPSLVVTNTGNPGNYTARIRGIGTQGDNPGLESAVGTLIDGVYRNRAGVAFGDLGELDRVEVLRGPQGTLFGRNTSAGILNILTKKPSFQGELFGEATVGSYDLFVGKAGANLVLLEDQLATRLFFVRHEHEGFIDLNPGRPDVNDGNATSYLSGRAQILWQPVTNASLRIIGDWSERDDQCCSAATVFAGSNGRLAANTSAPEIINAIEALDPVGPLLGKSTTNQVENQIAFGNRSTDSDIEDKGISAELNWDISGVKLTSISALRDWKIAFGQDADFSGADIAYFPTNGTNFNQFETFTHETRLTGDTPWVNWLIGAFYSDEDLTRRSTLTFGSEMEAFLSLHRAGATTGTLRGGLNGVFAHPLATPVFTGGAGDNDLYNQNAETIAVFTHNVFHLTDEIDLIAGVRWTTETKTYDATYRTTGAGGCASVEAAVGLDPVVNAAPGLAQSLAGLACVPFARSALDVLTATTPHHQERTEEEFSGIATLAWDIDNGLNAYGSYSRGHKAGGFNLDRAFTDKAGSIVSGVNVRAPDVSFEAELVDAFEIGLKTTTGDGKLVVNTAIFYQDFENYQLNTFTGTSFIVTSVPEVISQGVEVEAAWTTPIRGLTTNLGAVYNEARYGDIGAVTDPTSFLGRNPSFFLLKDAQITHAPEWTVTGAFDYATPIFDALTARLHMDARWQSEMNTGSNLDPRKEQDAYTVVGLKFGIYGEDDWIGLEFFARNLLDERYMVTAFDSPLQGSAVCATGFGGCVGPVGTPLNGSSTIDAFLGEPQTFGVTLRMKHD